MTRIKASDLPVPSHDSCLKYYKPLSIKKKKQIDMNAIGTPTYNMLLDLLKCQVKHPNIITSDGDAKKSCAKAEKNYNACHAAVMGVGNFNGMRHCGEEMEKLNKCVKPDS